MITVAAATNMGRPYDLGPLHHHMDPSSTKKTTQDVARNKRKQPALQRKGLCTLYCPHAHWGGWWWRFCWLAVVVSGANGHTLCTHHDRWAEEVERRRRRRWRRRAREHALGMTVSRGRRATWIMHVVGGDFEYTHLLWTWECRVPS